MGRFITIDPDTWWPTFHLHGRTAQNAIRYYAGMKNLPRLLKNWVTKQRTPVPEEQVIPPERDPYPPFTGANKPCPECGSWHVTWERQEQGITYPEGAFNLGVFSDGWMLRTCQQCQHAWPEECPTYPLPD